MALKDRDQEILDAEGLVTREQARVVLGIGKAKMRRLIKNGTLKPEWRVLVSSKRKVQVFREIKLVPLTPPQ